MTSMDSQRISYKNPKPLDCVTSRDYTPDTRIPNREIITNPGPQLKEAQNYLYEYFHKHGLAQKKSQSF